MTKEKKLKIWSKKEIARQEKELSVVVEIPPKLHRRSLIQALKDKAYDNRDNIHRYCNHSKTKREGDYIICRKCKVKLRML